MNSFICVLLCGLVALSTAEPPRFRSSRFRLSRQELAPTDDAPADPNADAPYPPATSPAPYAPSGVTPENPLLLPTEVTPAPAYGAPAIVYGQPPSPAYGPSADEPTTPNPEAETIAPVATSGRLQSAYLLLVDPATLKRVPIVPFQTQRQRQALPAKFRSRF